MIARTATTITATMTMAISAQVPVLNFFLVVMVDIFTLSPRLTVFYAVSVSSLLSRLVYGLALTY